MENTPSNINISFITINYNSSQHTVALIESIITHTLTDLNYKIIVVDNASDVED